MSHAKDEYRKTGIPSFVMTNATSEKPTASRSDGINIVTRVREFVRGQMREGAAAPDLSFALALVAAEMGLAIAPDPVSVFPVVLEAIAQAATRHCRGTSGTEVSEEQTFVLSSGTLH